MEFIYVLRQVPERFGQSHNRIVPFSRVLVFGIHYFYTTHHGPYGIAYIRHGHTQVRRLLSVYLYIHHGSAQFQVRIYIHDTRYPLKPFCELGFESLQFKQLRPRHRKLKRRTPPGTKALFEFQGKRKDARSLGKLSAQFGKNLPLRAPTLTFRGEVHKENTLIPPTETACGEERPYLRSLVQDVFYLFHHTVGIIQGRTYRSLYTHHKLCRV